MAHQERQQVQLTWDSTIEFIQNAVADSNISKMLYFSEFMTLSKQLHF